MNIEFGCGLSKSDGFVGVDIFGSPDVYHDLNVYPYPFDDSSADCIKAYHVVEHLDKPMQAIAEFHRILKPDGILELRLPHAGGLYANSSDHLTRWSAVTINQLTNPLFYLPTPKWICLSCKVKILVGKWTPLDWIASRWLYLYEKIGVCQPDEIIWIGRKGAQE